MSGVTLDAGALIALDRNDRRILALLARARETGARITLPATALAEVLRQPAQQARLSRLVRQPSTELVPLDGPDATQVGLLLAASRTSDVVDAHVVICARRNSEPIVTSDPKDLARLDPQARLVVV
jgi:predicted nucleic acid-binding protein